MTDVPALRRRVLAELATAGFNMSGGLIAPPEGDVKEVVRRLHAPQRSAILQESRDFILEHEEKLLDSFADGTEVDPNAIEPRVTTVATDFDAALFRFASLHWSVPVSQGYGRRTRFLVWDDSNGKLIAIFALGDPVFNLGVRDRAIGWNQDQRQARLYNVFDAFVLGAVEPYRQLLAGKLAALCTVSDEVLSILETKYAGATTVILRENKVARPVLVTTTSALGRSSVYNRIKIDGSAVFTSVGYTQGFGHFQFSRELFSELVALAVHLYPERVLNEYGKGPNWKMRTLRTALSELGLPGDLLRHGIRREVYLAPTSQNCAEFLRGEEDVIFPIKHPLDEMAAYYRERWAKPRAERRPEFNSWRRGNMRLSAEFPGATLTRSLF